MAKEKGSLQAIPIGILGSVILYLLMQLLLALAVVKGWVDEHRIPMLQTAAACMAAWMGCKYAAHHTVMKRICCAALVSGGLIGAILLLGHLCYGHTELGGGAGIRLAAIIGGGAAAALPGRGRGRRVRRKK